MDQRERDLRDLMCRVGQLMYQNGYIDATGGNISARLDADRILVSPSGLATGMMDPQQMLVVNLSGERVDPPDTTTEGLRPTSELPMHLECYRQRDDVRGVVHAHPPTAVALTLVGYDFQQCIIPEAVVLLGLMPTAPYSTPASHENRDAISVLIREHDAIMLANHGSITVADSVWGAYHLLECLEHCAKIIHKALQIDSDLATIPPAQVEKLLQYRENFGLMRPGDRERFSQFINV